MTVPVTCRHRATAESFNRFHLVRDHELLALIESLERAHDDLLSLLQFRQIATPPDRCIRDVLGTLLRTVEHMRELHENRRDRFVGAAMEGTP
jgi:hypothetical protein